MAFKFNALTGNFDIVTQTGDIDFSAIQGQIDDLTNRLDDVELDITDLQTFSQVFVTGDWLGPVSDTYYLVIPFVSHGKLNPIIQIYESVLTDYQQVECFTFVNNLNDIVISVNQVPDLRFNGKIIIS